MRETKRHMFALQIAQKVLDEALKKPVLISEAETDFLGFEEADRAMIRPIARMFVRGKTRYNNAKFLVFCRIFKCDRHEWKSLDAELSIEHEHLASVLGRSTWKFDVRVEEDFSEECVIVGRLIS